MKVIILDKRGDFYYIVDEKDQYYVIEITANHELAIGNTAIFNFDNLTIVDNGVSFGCLIYAEDVSEDRWAIIKGTTF